MARWRGPCGRSWRRSWSRRLSGASFPAPRTRGSTLSSAHSSAFFVDAKLGHWTSSRSRRVAPTVSSHRGCPAGGARPRASADAVRARGREQDWREQCATISVAANPRSAEHHRQRAGGSRDDAPEHRLHRLEPAGTPSSDHPSHVEDRSSQRRAATHGGGPPPAPPSAHPSNERDPGRPAASNAERAQCADTRGPGVGSGVRRPRGSAPDALRGCQAAEWPPTTLTRAIVVGTGETDTLRGTRAAWGNDWSAVRRWP